MSSYNVVQAEFFHFPGKPISLEEAVAHSLLRACEGSRIKTTVRFLDRTGKISHYAAKAQACNCEIKRLIAETVSGRMQKIIRDQRLKSQYRRKDRLGSVSRNAVRALSETIRFNQPVAIEESDFSFRLANRNELHELMEAVNAADKAWLFVFKPADLFADDVTMLHDVTK